MNTYTIGQVAKIVGLPTKTIRYYEQSGVITTAQRAENGYRKYPQAFVQELTLIKYIRDLSLPLGEMKKLMKGCESSACKHTRAHITSSIDEYVGLLGEKIHQFTVLKAKLQKLKSTLCVNEKACDETKYHCNILSQLAETK